MNRGNGSTISNASWESEKWDETFLWWNSAWISDTDAWDDTQGDVHIIMGSGTQVMLITIVYSAVIVVMMKIAQ